MAGWQQPENGPFPQAETPPAYPYSGYGQQYPYQQQLPPVFPPGYKGQPNEQGWYPQPQYAQPAPAKRRHRIFPWAFLAIQALFIIWIIAGARSAASSPQDCQYLTQQECRNAANAGAAIGAGLIIALWAFADVILGVGYLVLRRR